MSVGYVAGGIATASAIYGVSSILTVLKKGEGHRRRWLGDNYPASAAMFSESKWFQELMDFSVISPSWNDQFMGCLEALCVDYSRFRSVMTHTEIIHSEITKTIIPEVIENEIHFRNSFSRGDKSDYERDCRSDFWQYNAELLEWFNGMFCDMAKSVFTCTSMLESCVARYYHLNTLLAELINICRVYNIYWTIYGAGIFFKESIVPKKGSKEDESEAVTTKNGKKTSISRKSFGDNVINDFDADTEKKKSAVLLLLTKGLSEHDRSSANDDNITSHIRWWTILHCTFSPSMRKVAKLIGVHDDDFKSSWRGIVERIRHVSSTGNTDSLSSQNHQSFPTSKISMSSSPIDIAFCIAKTGWKEGFVNLMTRPFDLLLPSVNSAYYLPCNPMSASSIKNTCVEMCKMFRYLISNCNMISQFVMKSCIYRDNIFNELYISHFLMENVKRILSLKRNRSNNTNTSSHITIIDEIDDDLTKAVVIFYTNRMRHGVDFNAGFANNPLITGVNSKSRQIIRSCFDKLGLLSEMTHTL